MIELERQEKNTVMPALFLLDVCDWSAFILNRSEYVCTINRSSEDWAGYKNPLGVSTHLGMNVGSAADAGKFSSERGVGYTTGIAFHNSLVGKRVF